MTHIRNIKRFFNQGWQAFEQGELYDENAFGDWKDGWIEAEAAFLDNKWGQSNNQPPSNESGVTNKEFLALCGH